MGSSSLQSWSSLVSLSSISLPSSLSSLKHRLSSNISFFLINYINIFLIILFLSLIYHPLAVLIFLITAAAWFYFFINREDPSLTILDRSIDDRTVVICLLVVTLLALFLARVWANVFISVAVSGVVIGLHAALREPVDEQDTPYGSLLSDGVDSPSGGYAHV